MTDNIRNASDQAIQYRAPQVKVIEVTTQRIMCMSTMDGTQNESYGSGDTSGWY